MSDHMPDDQSANDQPATTPTPEAQFSPQASPAQDFRAQVQRLVAEGKLSAEEAAGLLDIEDEPASDAVGYRPAPAPPTDGVPHNLILDVSGYALQVVLDASVDRPQLQASQDGKLTLEATAQGWHVKRRADQRLLGWSNLSAMLLLPFTPLDVRATLGGGSLVLPDIHGEMGVKVGGGSLSMGQAGSLSANVGGGSVKTGHIHGAAQLAIGGGSALLSSSGPVSATVAGGSLNWQAQLNSGEHQVTVAGGSARIELAPGSSAELHAHATAGSVKTNFPVERSGQFATHTYRGRVGEGHAKLNVRVAGGSVVVQA